jgi:uncharacterized protein
MTFRHHALLTASLVFLSSCGARTASPPTADFGNSAVSHPSVIALAGRVTDAANILDPAQEAALTAKLEELERRTKHQMVIVTAPSLGGRDIADFTRDLANDWGIGREKEDDGVVLLVAPNERKVRIAVGYGLEKTLTHDVCAQIIKDQMLSRFGNGDLPGGIDAGTNELIGRLS